MPRGISNAIRVGLAAATLVLAIIAGSLGTASAAGVATSGACPTPSTDYGTASATANVTSAGTYYVWVHMKAASATANTVYLQAGGNTCINVDGNTSTTAFKWTNQGISNGNTGVMILNNLTVSSSYAIKLIGNAAGVEVDKIILTTDASCNPANTGNDCPTTAPAPTVTVTPNPPTVTSGGSTTVTWNAQNATSCQASGDWSGAQAVSGSQTFTNLTSNKAYVLQCTGAGGTDSGTASVTVTPADNGGGNTNGGGNSGGDTGGSTGGSDNGGSTQTATPSVSINVPADGENITSGSAAITADASSSAGIANVVFSVNGVPQQTVTTAPYTFNWNTAALPDDSYVLTATANGTDGGVNSDTVTVTVQNAQLPAPAAPTNVTTRGTLSGDSYQVVVGWDASEGATGYYVIRDGVGLSLQPVTGTSYTDTVPADGTTHKYVIVAANAAGVSDPSAVGSFVATQSSSGSNSGSGSGSSVAAPTGLTATPDGTQVTRSWDAPSSDVAAYTVYRADQGSSNFTSIGSGITDTNFGDSGLQPGNTYQYYVVAVSNTGVKSSKSDTVNATIANSSSSGGTTTPPSNSHGSGTGGDCVVNGTVTDSNGSPLVGATITITYGGKQHTYTTNSDGAFVLSGLNKGNHRLHYSRGGYNSSDQTVSCSSNGSTVHHRSHMGRNRHVSGNYWSHWDYWNWNYSRRGRR